ncbi:hypothetical protein E2C01_097294 [Portunus trituberculatus]|uniref:Uncharacterized protein n=1 Tax=Portunus trituberculatus TaxID=210409 RepID=A0A5B7JXY2_PORTR|nr:hypothetical protein [Portunus trituberculatus]
MKSLRSANALHTRVGRQWPRLCWSACQWVAHRRARGAAHPTSTMVTQLLRTASELRAAWASERDQDPHPHQSFYTTSLFLLSSLCPSALVPPSGLSAAGYTRLTLPRL